MALIPSRSPPPSSLAPFLSWMRALLQYSTLIKRYDSNSLLSEHVASPRSALEQILLEFVAVLLARTVLLSCEPTMFHAFHYYFEFNYTFTLTLERKDQIAFIRLF